MGKRLFGRIERQRKSFLIGRRNRILRRAVLARSPKGDAAIQGPPTPIGAALGTIGALRSLDRRVASLLAMTRKEPITLVQGFAGYPFEPLAQADAMREDRPANGAAEGLSMRGDPSVIDYLNTALRHELAAVNQYWLHYRILDNWGYKDFAKTWREESIEEMRHADTIVARILFLDGHPNMQLLGQLRIGKSVKDVIDCDLAAEMDARALYLEAAKHCESVNDRVSKILFETLTADEEKHIDFLETQLTLISQIGEPLFAQKHIGKLED